MNKWIIVLTVSVMSVPAVFANETTQAQPAASAQADKVVVQKSKKKARERKLKKEAVGTQQEKKQAEGQPVESSH